MAHQLAGLAQRREDARLDTCLPISRVAQPWP